MRSSRVCSSHFSLTDFRVATSPPPSGLSRALAAAATVPRTVHWGRMYDRSKYNYEATHCWRFIILLTRRCCGLNNLRAAQKVRIPISSLCRRWNRDKTTSPTTPTELARRACETWSTTSRKDCIKNSDLADNSARNIPLFEPPRRQCF